MSPVPLKDALKVDQRYILFVTISGPWQTDTVRMPGDFFVTDTVDDDTLRTLVKPKTEYEIAQERMYARANITLSKLSDVFYWRKVQDGDLKAVLDNGHDWVYSTPGEWISQRWER